MAHEIGRPNTAQQSFDKVTDSAMDPSNGTAEERAAKLRGHVEGAQRSGVFNPDSVERVSKTGLKARILGRLGGKPVEVEPVEAQAGDADVDDRGLGQSRADLSNAPSIQSIGEATPPAHPADGLQDPGFSDELSAILDDTHIQKD